MIPQNPICKTSVVSARHQFVWSICGSPCTPMSYSCSSSIAASLRAGDTVPGDHPLTLETAPHQGRPDCPASPRNDVCQQVIIHHHMSSIDVHLLRLRTAFDEADGLSCPVSAMSLVVRSARHVAEPRCSEPRIPRAISCRMGRRLLQLGWLFGARAQASTSWDFSEARKALTCLASKGAF